MQISQKSLAWVKFSIIILKRRQIHGFLKNSGYSSHIKKNRVELFVIENLKHYCFTYLIAIWLPRATKQFFHQKALIFRFQSYTFTGLGTDSDEY